MEETPDKDASEATDVKKAPRKSETKRYSEIFRDFDNLELSLEYPSTDDADSPSIPEAPSTETEDLTERDDVPQCEDTFCPEILRSESDPTELDGRLSAQDADLVLCRCEGGVEMALQYTKTWCRYAKDLLAWMEKRMNLEQEFSKNIMKAAEGAKSCVSQQVKMPLQYIYTMALEQDIKNSGASRQTIEQIQHRCYQALAAKRNELDKWRREFKEQWTKQQKKMNDAVSALKKARHQYLQRCEELEKARVVDDMSGHKTIDKKKKSRDEAQTKMTESESLYRQCVYDARFQQDDLVKAKDVIISHIRKLVCQGDTVLKEATVNMFYYQRQQTEAVPLGYHNLEMICRPVEPGEPYLQYILSKRLPEQPLQTFTFQEYIGKGSGKIKRKTSNPLSTLPDSFSLLDDSLDGRRPIYTRRMGYSDSESLGDSMESLSSPAHCIRMVPKAPSTGTMSSEDLDERDMATVLESDSMDSAVEANGFGSKVRTPSRAALTHRLRKMKSKMVKCKQCDNYIMVNGIECEECPLAVHRKCLEVCQMECEQRKGVLFGVGLSMLLRNSRHQVPLVVRRCTEEIESRALDVQGVYRISGSKPRIQRLVQAFENQGDHLDLSEHSPHDISSALKHFFKELPEPLFTFDLYNDFIRIGKTVEASGSVHEVILNLRQLLERLPSYCYSTLHHMMCHLHRVSEHYEENKMTSGNLGIVFGPTLLRPLVSVEASMDALLETSYQAVIVEFLVTHQEQVFGPRKRANTDPPPAPTAPLPDTPPRRTSAHLEVHISSAQDHGASSRERPRSLESRAIKRESSEGYISDKSSSNEAVDQLSPEANEGAVLAVKGVAGGPIGEPDSLLGIQQHHYFSRQPVVRYYHQQHLTPGTQHCNPSGPAGGAGQPRPEPWKAGAPGNSADSSRSSSPEPGKLIDPHPETTHQTNRAEGKVEILPPRPREAVQCTLGLGTTSTTSSPPVPSAAQSIPTQRTAPEARCGRQANLNMNQSNNKQNVGQGRALCHSPPPPQRLPVEQARSAHTILSGLKLRGKDHGQLFV